MCNWKLYRHFTTSFLVGSMVMYINGHYVCVHWDKLYIVCSDRTRMLDVYRYSSVTHKLEYEHVRTYMSCR